MKKLTQLILILCLPLCLYAQTPKKAVAAKPTKQDDLQKQINATNKTLNDFKAAIIDSVNKAHATKTDNVYGYITWKNSTVKLYDLSNQPIQNKTYDYKTQNEKYKASNANNPKLKDKDLEISDNAKFSYKAIDSILIRIKKNTISRIIIFSGVDISVDNVNLNFTDLNDMNVFVEIVNNGEKDKLRINDLLIFVPVDNDDNVDSVNIKLSPSNKRVILTTH